MQVPTATQHVRGIRDDGCVRAAVEIFSGCLLLYTAFVVPVQLSFWNSNDPCDTNPTLPFDMFTDLFFLVSALEQPST